MVSTSLVRKHRAAEFAKMRRELKRQRRKLAKMRRELKRQRRKLAKMRRELKRQRRKLEIQNLNDKVEVEYIPKPKIDEKLYFTEEEYASRCLIIPEDEAAEFAEQARRRWKKENRKLHIPNLNNKAEVAELRKRLQRKTSSDLIIKEDGEVKDYEYGYGVCANMDENHYDSDCPWLDKLPPDQTIVGPYYDIVCIGCGQIGELCCSKRGSKRGYAVLKSCIFCHSAGHWPWECLTGPKIPGLTEELIEEVISS